MGAKNKKSKATIIKFKDSLIKCTNCGSTLQLNLRHCPSCQSDQGFPNIRECEHPSELHELQNRFKNSEIIAERNGTKDQFFRFKKLIEISHERLKGIYGNVLMPEIYV